MTRCFHSLCMILIVLIIPDSPIYSQNNAQSYSSAEKLSRYRLGGGQVTLLSEDNDLIFKHLFLNLNYRSSGFELNSDKFQIKFAFETGINGLIISERNSNSIDDFFFVFVPYAKTGPEARLYKNIFLGTSAGLIGGFFGDRFGVAPFIGVNGFYLYPLNENIFIELESGIHTTFYLPILFYITINLSLL